MGIIDTLKAMSDKDKELEKEKKEKIALAQSKKKLENHQKGRWYMLELLEKEGFKVVPKMKENESAIHSLKIKLENGSELILKVHTHPENQQGYLLNEVDEKRYDNKTFHIFVDFIDKEIPDFWIIPSEFVAKSIEEAHTKWLETPGKKGQPHNPCNTRVFMTKLKGTEALIRPTDWEDQLKKYYKNLEILKV